MCNKNDVTECGGRLMQWWLYEKQKDAQNSGISLWLLIFIYVIVIAFFLFIRIATWPNEKHIDALFLFRQWCSLF